MPEKPEYAKCACESCGGHIEFPANLGGTTIDCPHCHFPTTLPLPVVRTSERGDRPNSALLKAVVLLALVSAIAYGAWRVNTQSAAGPQPIPAPIPAMSNATSSPAPAKPSPPQWHGLESEGDVKIEKAGQGKLIYAVGVLRNTTEMQKFGVKVQLDLFDSGGAKVGSASDYTANIAAGKEWRFRALALAPNATKAKITEVTED